MDDLFPFPFGILVIILGGDSGVFIGRGMLDVAVDPFRAAIDEPADPLTLGGLQDLAGPFDIDLPVDLVGELHPAKGGGYMKDHLVTGDRSAHQVRIGDRPQSDLGPQSGQLIEKKPSGVIHHRDLVTSFQKPPDQLTAGEPGPAGDQTGNGLHASSLRKPTKRIYNSNIIRVRVQWEKSKGRG